MSEELLRLDEKCEHTRWKSMGFSKQLVPGEPSIHFLKLSPKLNFLRAFSIQDHSRESKAFLKSTDISIPGVLST